MDRAFARARRLRLPAHALRSYPCDAHSRGVPPHDEPGPPAPRRRLALGRRLVRRVLGESRFATEVDEAEDGEQALKLMRSGLYDVALIDRDLPRLDGLELACQAAKVAPTTRIVLMEGRGEDQAARQFGIVALLQKPFYVWDLDLALHAAFDLRRPCLMNALPAYYEAEAQKTRERLAETAAAYARRTDPAPAAPPADKEAAGVFYI